MDTSLLIRRIMLLFLYSPFAGYAFVYIVGEKLGIQRNIQSITKVAIGFFLGLSIPFIVLPLVGLW